jgi:hypothetical protein
MKSKPTPFADPVPLPQAEELGHDTGWALWNYAVERHKRTFAPTEPMTALATFGAGFAPTQPAHPSSPASGTPRPAAAPKVTMEVVMQLARHRNRVCPIPARWRALHELLALHATDTRSPPPEPLHGAAWAGTPPLAKRMVFRDQLEWAERQGCLAEVHAFLKGLADADWHHMGG